MRPLVLFEPASVLTPANTRTRWRPVVPVGIAHATTKADMYDGYDIPEGATVFANIEYVWTSSFELVLRPMASDAVISQCACQGP